MSDLLADGIYPGYEGPALEFKEGYSSGDSSSKVYQKVIVSFMNGQGGRIVFGVTDQRVIQGVTDTPDDVHKRIREIVTVGVYPEFLGRIDMTVKTVTARRNVIEFEVARDAVEHPEYHIVGDSTMYRRMMESCRSKEYCPFVPRDELDAQRREVARLLLENERLKGKESDLEPTKADQKLMKSQKKRIDSLEKQLEKAVANNSILHHELVEFKKNSKSDLDAADRAFDKLTDTYNNLLDGRKSDAARHLIDRSNNVAKRNKYLLDQYNDLNNKYNMMRSQFNANVITLNQAIVDMKTVFEKVPNLEELLRD